MKVISWNIGWGSKKEKIALMLKHKLEQSLCVACLQEVTPSVKKYLQSFIGEQYLYLYSLDSRFVGEFDTKSRKLGVLIIISKTFTFLYSHVLDRTPFPDRTLFVSFAYLGVEYRVMSLHSVTGCNYSKAKSVQFYSFAEAIAAYHPDIVTFDANEPKEDHFDEDKRVYFDNKDKGRGAKTFFKTLVNCNLQDAYASLFDKNSFQKGSPLAVSHIINKKECKRYDFVYIHRKFNIIKCEYLYDESIKASADHSMVIAEIIEDSQIRSKHPNLYLNTPPFEGCVPTAELLNYCLYYKGETEFPASLHRDVSANIFWDYERCWVEFSQHNRGYIAGIVQEYIFEGLELFNCDDGVPISLKALLFNRFQHWTGGWDNVEFKKFYLENYKQKK